MDSSLSLYLDLNIDLNMDSNMAPIIFHVNKEKTLMKFFLESKIFSIKVFSLFTLNIDIQLFWGHIQVHIQGPRKLY